MDTIECIMTNLTQLKFTHFNSFRMKLIQLNAYGQIEIASMLSVFVVFFLVGWGGGGRGQCGL